MKIQTLERATELATAQEFIRGEITEWADSTDLDDAIVLVDELNRLASACREAVALLEGQMLGRLEETGARQVGGRVFARVKDYVERFDHEVVMREAIRQGVEAAVDKDTGYVNANEAAEAAVRTMFATYLSDSSKAKVTVLDKLGLDRKTYRTKEFKRWKLAVTSIDSGDDE
jgi:hypothetical protein